MTNYIDEYLSEMEKQDSSLEQKKLQETMTPSLSDTQSEVEMLREGMRLADQAGDAVLWNRFRTALANLSVSGKA